MSVTSGYKITVAGQYFVREGEKRLSLKSYQFDINMPSMDSVLSIIKNKVLDVVLPQKYPDYAGYRTHEILDVKPFGDVAPTKAVLWQMNRPTILSYIKENELPVEEEIYETLMDLREAVQMAEADPDNFKKVQEKDREDFKVISELRALNPDLFVQAEEKGTGEQTLSDTQKYPVIEDPIKETVTKEKQDVLADFMT